MLLEVPRIVLHPASINLLVLLEFPLRLCLFFGADLDFGASSPMDSRLGVVMIGDGRSHERPAFPSLKKNRLAFLSTMYQTSNFLMIRFFLPFV